MDRGQHEEADGVEREPAPKGPALAQPRHRGTDQAALHQGEDDAHRGKDRAGRHLAEGEAGLPEQGQRHLEGAERDQGHEGQRDEPADRGAFVAHGRVPCRR